MTHAIHTVVFPVAGHGTRFLPATKAQPKEMLPVVDKPLIQYAVEEAIASGARRLVFVTGRNKRAIEDHFDRAFELESELVARGKDDMLETVEEVVPPGVDCIYVRQSTALGLGHAILCARSVVGNQPFGVILPDDLIDCDAYPAMAQLMDQYRRDPTPLVSVKRVPMDLAERYGIVATGIRSGGIAALRGIIEKPEPEAAPSNLAVVGRYVLTPRIFELLADTSPGHGGEIQLTDAIARLIEETRVNSFEFQGTHFDCGSKLGYLEATVEYGLKHAELGMAFGAYLKRRLRDGFNGNAVVAEPVAAPALKERSEAGFIADT